MIELNEALPHRAGECCGKLGLADDDARGSTRAAALLRWATLCASGARSWSPRPSANCTEAAAGAQHHVHGVGQGIAFDR